MQEPQELKPDSNRAGAEPSRQFSWWGKLSAIIALLNFILVLFNLSYIPLRDVYLRQVPSLVALSDPYKGIEPHPVTQKYLKTVNDLTVDLAQNGLRSPESERLLSSLRSQSAAMLEENPFLAASKWGLLAKIQRRMRQHVGGTSAKQAFETFWSADYLERRGWDKEVAFLNREIRPLIQTNYFRNVDNYGQVIDEFWRIDIWFAGFFAVEFAVSTFLFSRRRAGVRWTDAMLRHWYDVLLIVPVWRWLRVIPVTVRLHKSGLVNLDRALAEIAHEPATYLADLVSKFMIVRFINQAQDAIKQGEAARLLLNPQPYIEVNDVNEVETIVDRLLRLTIYKVLPRLQPNIKALTHHTLEGALKQSEFYQNIRQIPGLGELQKQVTEQLASNLSEGAADMLSSSYSDTQGREILERLRRDFSEAFVRELQDKETLSELQSLMSDLLEEVKLNYVMRSTESEAHATMEEVTELDKAAESVSPAAQGEPVENSIPVA